MATLTRGTPLERARRGFYQPVDPWAVVHRGLWTQSQIPIVPIDPSCPPIASPLFLLLPMAEVDLIPLPFATADLLAPIATHEVCLSNSIQEGCEQCN